MAGFKKLLLDEDYFYNHAEAHRRRPTIVRFPQIVLHVAVFFEAGDQSQNIWDLTAFLRNYLQRDYDALDRARITFRVWLRQFEDAAWTRRRSTGSATSPSTPSERCTSDFLDRFAHAEHEPTKFRWFRKHSEASEPGDVEFVFEALHEENPEIVVRCEAHREYFTLTLFLPINEPATLAESFASIDRRLFPTAPEEAPGETAHQKLIRSIAKDFPKATFANFRGIVTDCRRFGAVPDTSKLFAKGGAPQAEFINEASGLAERFLRDNRAALDNSVFLFDGGEDAIACYLQRGRAIYISSLGSQKTNQSRDELRYVVLYDGFEAEKSAIERFRLSRLVFRLNTLGTLRLAALRDLRQMRVVGDELRRIEDDLEKAAYLSRWGGERDRALMRVIDRLERLADPHNTDGSPILHRANRARYYFAQIKRLLEDVDVGEIATWQTYRQFLHRRLYSTLEYASELGERIADVWRVARSRLELVESRTLLWLQNASTLVSLLLLPLAVADIAAGKPPAIVGKLGQNLLCAAVGVIRPDLVPAVAEPAAPPCRIVAGEEWERDDSIADWTVTAEQIEFWTIYTFALAIVVVMMLLWVWSFRRPKARERKRFWPDDNG